MNVFLDASVLLAACGRATGASRAVFDFASRAGWRLLAGAYVIRETELNLKVTLGPNAEQEWVRLKPALTIVDDEWTFDWPVVFPAAKDKPVLFTAAATADVLLTLDKADFGHLMTSGFYGLQVMKPGDFLLRERASGRIS